MSNDLDKLREDYRRLKAPPQLAARVRAEVTERRDGISWLPRLATVVLVIAVPLALMLDHQPGRQATQTRIPSLSQLVPQAPAVSMSSLGSLRGVPLPPLPSKPDLRRSLEGAEDAETKTPPGAPIQKPAQSRVFDHASPFEYPTNKETHYEHA
jgi:hypothetical protein